MCVRIRPLGTSIRYQLNGIIVGVSDRWTTDQLEFHVDCSSSGDQEGNTS